MRYPVAVENADLNTAFGVVVPDLPGCFSAGDSIEEALYNVKEAIRAWIEVAVEDGDPVPKPSTIETVRGNSDFGGWIISEVDLGI